jgi:hypothetical protein
MQTLDYSQFIEPKADEDALARLSKLVDELDRTERRILELQAETEKAGARRKKLAEEDIPELMQSVGQEVLRVPSGATVQLKKVVHASILDQNKPAAFRWFEENGHGDMIKRNVIVAFNREQEAEAKTCVEDLKKKYPQVQVKRDIHWMTLNSWVRSRLSEGKEVPALVATHDATVAEITK